MIAGAWFTVRLNDWVTSDPTPLVALIVMGQIPPVPPSGVPARLPVAERVTPAGSVPLAMLNFGEGKPVAVAVNEPTVPVVKVALSAEVMAGAWLTVSVNACVASVPTPLAALRVTA